MRRAIKLSTVALVAVLATNPVAAPPKEGGSPTFVTFQVPAPKNTAACFDSVRSDFDPSWVAFSSEWVPVGGFSRISVGFRLTLPDGTVRPENPTHLQFRNFAGEAPIISLATSVAGPWPILGAEVRPVLCIQESDAGFAVTDFSIYAGPQ